MLPDAFENIELDAGSGGMAGSPDAGSGGSHGGQGGDAGSGAGGSIDPARSRVLSIVPPDGARGVAPDAEIVVTFSEPMEPTSTERAYTSSDIPAEAVTFSWNEEHTVLRVLPNSPLVVASGADPETLEPATYELSLSDTAKAQSGRALVPQHIEFAVMREITQSVAAEPARNLSGNYRSDDTYGIVDCVETAATVCAGDTSSGGVPVTYKGFATFELSALPAELIALTVARLEVQVEKINGTPFSDLGSLNVEHVGFDAIGLAAFDAEPQSVLGVLAYVATPGDTLSLDVLSSVSADRGARSQYRFAFTNLSDGGIDVDHVVLALPSMRLIVTYTIP